MEMVDAKMLLSLFFYESPRLMDCGCSHPKAFVLRFALVFCHSVVLVEVLCLVFQKCQPLEVGRQGLMTSAGSRVIGCQHLDLECIVELSGDWE